MKVNVSHLEFHVFKKFKNYIEHINPYVFLKDIFIDLPVVDLYISYSGFDSSTLPDHSKSTYKGIDDEEIKIINKFRKEKIQTSNKVYAECVGGDVDSDYSEVNFAPVIIKSDDKSTNLWFSLKLFRRGGFLLELYFETQKGNLSRNDFPVFKNSTILKPSMNKLSNNPEIVYIKRSGELQKTIIEYRNNILSRIYNRFRSETYHEKFVLMYLDENLVNNENVKSSDLLELLESKYELELGFSKIDENIYSYKHFKYYKKDNKVAFGIDKNKYDIKSSEYKKKELHFRTMNIKFFKLAIEPLFYDRFLNKLKSLKLYTLTKNADTNSTNAVYFISNLKLNYNYINNTAVLKVRELKENIERNTINKEIVEEVEQTHRYRNELITQLRNEKNEKSMWEMNLILMIITLLSLTQTINIFIGNKLYIFLITMIMLLLVIMRFDYKKFVEQKENEDIINFGEIKKSNNIYLYLRSIRKKRSIVKALNFINRRE